MEHRKELESESGNLSWHKMYFNWNVSKAAVLEILLWIMFSEWLVIELNMYKPTITTTVRWWKDGFEWNSSITIFDDWDYETLS